MNRIYKCRLLRSICSFLLLILISYNAFGNNSTHTQSKEVIKDNLVSNNSSNHEAKLFNKVAIYTLYTDPDDKVNPSKIYQTQFNVESKILFQYQPPYFYTMGNEPQVIPTIAYDPSGKYLFAGGYSRGINFKNQMTTYEIYPRGVLYQTITNTHTTVGDKPTVGKIIIDPKGRYLYQFYKYQSGQQVIDTYIIRYGGGIEFTNNSTPLENIAKYDMAITPNGKYAYVTNPEINQISIYTIDDYIGKLQKIASVNSGGYTPHNIVIEPNGKYLYVYNSAITGSSPRNLTVFKINDNNGYLIPVHSVVLQNSATDVVVDPKTGDYLYVSMGRVITTYSISKDTGELRQTAVFNMDPSVGSISAMAIDNSGSFISVVDSLCKSHLYVLGIDKVNGGKLSLIASKYLSSKCLLEEDSYPTVNIMKDISSIDFQKSLAGINDENTFKSFLSNSRFFHTLNYSRPLPNVVELQNYNLKILD
ncbi:MAG: lactonase family protein, partial [Neisseriaceae bacterium]